MFNNIFSNIFISQETRSYMFADAFEPIYMFLLLSSAAMPSSHPKGPHVFNKLPETHNKREYN